MHVPLKYGCNPHQGDAAFEAGYVASLRVRNGTPSMINMLDALNGWQLVAELGGVLNIPAATSFKHVSPAGSRLARLFPRTSDAPMRSPTGSSRRSPAGGCRTSSKAVAILSR